MKYRKKPVVIEADQWHGHDYSKSEPQGPVKFFVTPVQNWKCAYCAGHRHDHGWIQTLEGGHIVCPGDYIITGVAGEKYPCKPEIFHRSYELAEPVAGGEL